MFVSLALSILLTVSTAKGTAENYNVWRANPICKDSSPPLQKIQQLYQYQTLELTKPKYSGNISIVNPGAFPVVETTGFLIVAEEFVDAHFRTNTTVTFFGTTYYSSLEIILDGNCDGGDYGKFCETVSTDKTSSTPPQIRNGFSFPNIEFVYVTSNEKVTSVILNIITNDGLIVNGWNVNLDSNANVINYYVYTIQ